LSRRFDDNLGASGTRRRTDTFNLLDDIVSLNDLSEDNVLAIEPGCLGGADEDCVHATKEKIEKQDKFEAFQNY
jgi:hypothetical protein